LADRIGIYPLAVRGAKTSAQAATLWSTNLNITLSVPSITGGSSRRPVACAWRSGMAVTVTMVLPLVSLYRPRIRNPVARGTQRSCNRFNGSAVLGPSSPAPT
jgi:hypothetical protein